MESWPSGRRRFTANEVSCYGSKGSNPLLSAYVKTLEFISRVFTYTRSVQVFRQVYNPSIKLRSKSDYSFKSRVNPLLSAKKRNQIPKQKYGRHKVPSVLTSPKKNPNLKGFATQSVAQKRRFDP